MPNPNLPEPRGVAFSIPEHVAFRAWAAANRMQVLTEIDRVIAGEEYEEVLALYDADGAWRRLTLWRTQQAVMFEPAVGPARRFSDIWDTIEAADGLIRMEPVSRKRRS